MTVIDPLLATLNPAQREAVEAPDGPLLIFAGAGSGKTRVLTHRIAHVIGARGVRSNEIVAVTFTNKAAREMRSRVEELLGESVAGMWLGTFHAIGARILRRDGDAIGIPSTFSIYDEADRVSAMRRAIQSIGLDEKRFPAAKVVHQVSAAKNEMLTAAEYQAKALGSYEAEVAKAYRAYEAEMSAAAALDFDDLLMRPVQLLRDVPPVLEHYQRRWRHVFVDEYQDTNHSQYLMVSLLAASHRNLTVVGDDDQCMVAGTAVTLSDGSTRSIETIRAGDTVLSAAGSGTFRPAQVMRSVRRRARGEVVRIRTAAGREVVSTPEHTHFSGYRPGLERNHRPQSRNSSRRNIVVTLCSDKRGATPMHRLSVVGNDETGAMTIRRLGLSVRPSRKGGQSWRHETAAKDLGAVLATAERLRVALGGHIVQVARLGHNLAGYCGSNSLPLVPAASVHPGMVMVDADGGWDEVESVERLPYDGDVYDIDVQNTHNYIANDIVTHNSIYRWRGADIRNILEFRRDYPDAQVVTLEQNYRSTQQILDTAHAVISRNTGRAAKRLWTETSGGEPVRLITVYDEQEEAMAICSEIESLIGGGSSSLADCAVLYRTNAQSRAFEEVLLRRGIPYRLVGGMRFYERREVKDVLAYLRLLANPRDAVSFGRIVNVPRRKIGDKTVRELEKVARRKRISPFEATQHLSGEASMTPAAVQSLTHFFELVESLRGLAARLPVPQLVDRVLAETGYQSMVRDGTPEGEERWNNVLELVGLAGEYADIAAPEGLQQFLENVALVSDVDTMDDNAQGVTLITLHQVKGLEFPIVFMAGLEEGLLPHVRALEEGDEGIAEERRLTYVGVTRAQRRLYLLHAYRRHLYGAAHLAEASRFLAEIPAELLDVRRRPGGPSPVAPRTPGAVRDAVHAHAVRANPVESAPQRYGQGDRVEHPKFGSGTVLKSTMTRSGEEVVIKFDDAGMKIFAVADAVLYPAS
ncbi:MAG: ATP-dependent helicase [Candidatus Dormibacteria bacterium]